MRAPGGESFQDVLKRTEDFYHSLVQNKAYENATIFISTHGQPDAVFWQIFMMIKKISGAGESRKTVLSALLR